MLVTMSHSSHKHFLQQSFDSNSEADADLTKQMQDYIKKLQQELAVEMALRRIVDAVRDSLDEAYILKTAMRELALELEADCYISLNQDSETDQQLRAKENSRLYFNTNSSKKEITSLSYPIVSGNEQLGFLWVNREISRTLTNSELYLVQQVVKQCAIAIEHARLYQAAQKQVEELKQLNELKDDFLNRVTHDLRSPLTNMRLAIHMLKHQLTAARSYCGHISEQNSACSKTLIHLGVLQTECEREITLVDDLLDLQRLESDKQPLSLVDLIDLENWLPDLLQSFEEHIQQRQLTLDLHISSHLPSLVSNSGSLHRVLSELLHNACKYTPPHETISLNVSCFMEYVQIQVSNSGIEIPHEELSQIFDKFYRIPGSDRWKQGGTGLGLALVKEMVAHLGGSVQSKSEDGQTSFIIQLPLQPSA